MLLAWPPRRALTRAWPDLPTCFLPPSALRSAAVAEKGRPPGEGHRLEAARTFPKEMPFYLDVEQETRSLCTEKKWGRGRPMGAPQRRAGGGRVHGTDEQHEHVGRRPRETRSERRCREMLFEGTFIPR